MKKKIEKPILPTPQTHAEDFEKGGKYWDRWIMFNDYQRPTPMEPKDYSDSQIAMSLALRNDFWIVCPIVIDGKPTGEYRAGIILGWNQGYPKVSWRLFGTDAQLLFSKGDSVIYQLSEMKFITEVEDKIDKSYYDSPEWMARRVRIIWQQENKCADCGKHAVKDIHHVTYNHLYNEPLEDLVGLCGYCHLERHGKRYEPGSILSWLPEYEPLYPIGFDPNMATDAECREIEEWARQRFNC